MENELRITFRKRTDSRTHYWALLINGKIIPNTCINEVPNLHEGKAIIVFVPYYNGLRIGNIGYRSLERAKFRLIEYVNEHHDQH